MRVHRLWVLPQPCGIDVYPVASLCETNFLPLSQLNLDLHGDVQLQWAESWLPHQPTEHKRMLGVHHCTVCQCTIMLPMAHIHTCSRAMKMTHVRIPRDIAIAAPIVIMSSMLSLHVRPLSEFPACLSSGPSSLLSSPPISGGALGRSDDAWVVSFLAACAVSFLHSTLTRLYPFPAQQCNMHDNPLCISLQSGHSVIVL